MYIFSNSCQQTPKVLIRCVLILFIGNFNRRVKIVIPDFNLGKEITSFYEVSGCVSA